MIRCYTGPQPLAEGVHTLSPDESHHMVRVLRGRVGAEIELFDGIGGVATAVIEAAHTKHAMVRVGLCNREPPPKPGITLFQALPKMQGMDAIVRKAVELGVAAIQPLLTEYCEQSLKGDHLEKKKVRWEKIALEAAKQSKRAWLPMIHPIRSVGDVLTGLDVSALQLIGVVDVSAANINQVLARITKRPEAVGIWIGPEGDFSRSEIEQVETTGGTPVHFGTPVLRVETAAIFALSVLQFWAQSETLT